MLGSLRKMRTELAHPVGYHLPLAEQSVAMNALLGHRLSLRYSGQIFCIHCQRKTSKSFNQGYCYPCFTRLAQCDMCILKPETCHFDQGTCREPEWGQQFCYQPHFVYLANTSALKVGITRQSQIPTRWMDQGAVQALPVMKVASRHISGLVEVVLANHVSDKTGWQRMLKNQTQPIDLKSKRDELFNECQSEFEAVAQRFGPQSIEYLPDAEVVTIDYPVMAYPAKVKSMNFDKHPEVSGVLQGIKGQYLIFDSGVINIRKFAGYEVEFVDHGQAQE